MAARRSPRQLAETAKFIQDLYKRSGAATWAEFAGRAGVHWAQLSKWQRGAGGVDGYNLLLLIRAAGAEEDVSAIDDKITRLEQLAVSLQDIQAARSPAAVAEDLVDRLNAGEEIPRSYLERVATEVDGAGDSMKRLAARIRRGHQSANEGR